MMIEAPSPNLDSRDGHPVDILLLHYTGMESGEIALDRLRNPEAKVSAHYMIEEDGRVFCLVPEDQRAWHAGVAQWAGARNINHRSIGIELVNPGHEWGYRPFPEAQMRVLIDLCREILARHPVPAHRVLGHSDVAPGRKSDPGELFDWRRLAEAGIGLWPGEETEADEGSLLHGLARFGYALDLAGPEAAIAAFQRHYRPEAVTGIADPQTAARLAALLLRVDAGQAKT